MLILINEQKLGTPRVPEWHWRGSLRLDMGQINIWNLIEFDLIVLAFHVPNLSLSYFSCLSLKGIFDALNKQNKQTKNQTRLAGDISIIRFRFAFPHWWKVDFNGKTDYFIRKNNLSC